MSFAMTTEQVMVKTKTVTRRFGWLFLKPGDIVHPVEKAMGLKKGEKIKRIHDVDGKPIVIQIVSTRLEPLNKITTLDVTREGFPWLDKNQFVDMLVKKYNCNPADECNRILFKYI